MVALMAHVSESANTEARSQTSYPVTAIRVKRKPISRIENKKEIEGYGRSLRHSKI
ncbi:hypothetical protein OROGR_029415 [Orobanche gracilis]